MDHAENRFPKRPQAPKGRRGRLGCLALIGVIFTVSIGQLYWGLSMVHRETLKMYGSFTVGKPVTEFALADTKITFINFYRSGKQDTEHSSRLIVRGLKDTCSVNLWDQTGAVHLEEAVAGSQVPQYLRAHMDVLRGYDEMHVSVRSGMAVTRTGSFIVRYGKDGIVTSKSPPKFWD
jgi:hypothetical protein